MPDSVIALLCDCDGTLCPDTTNLLVEELGLNPEEFWQRDVAGLVEDGWDPPLAYLSMLMRKSESSPGGRLTRSKLETTGSKVQFYPGALDFVDRLRKQLGASPEYRESGVRIDWYIVSSGIEDVLRATALEGLAADIFGCAFEIDGDDNVVGIKRSVSFTEKTKFVYAINKGISGPELRRRPYRVNDAMPMENRPVPFEHMVYIGDGPSDIPCFSMISKLKGKAIGVWPPDDDLLKKSYELALGERITVGPYGADYRDGTDLFKMLSRIVQGIADLILEERAQQTRSAPSH